LVVVFDMKLTDPVYGSVELDEPVLEELMSSAALQRLKGVSQIGANQFLQRGGFSRFEHSVGVCLLLRRFNAPLEEQVMGLIHDVSHPAFSHVMDFVFGTGKNEDFHEQVFRQQLEKSDIPMILKKHELDVNDFFDAERYSMLEQPLPNLCADRIDYFLRHLTHEYQRLDLAKKFSAAIRFDPGIGFFVSDPATGKEMGEWFLRENREIFTDSKMVAVTVVLANAISAGLRIGALYRDDLWKTDEWVLDRLRQNAHPSIQDPLQKIFRGFEAVDDPITFDIQTEKKNRVIDPWVETSPRQYARVSSIFEDYKSLLEKEKTDLQKTRFIRIQ